MLDKTEWFECECGSDEHTLRFILDLDNHPNRDTKYPRIPEIYTNVFLNHYDEWYKRLWRGIKYTFGYKCKYGHYDSFTMKTEDAQRLINLVEQLVEARSNIDTTNLREKQAENAEKFGEFAEKVNMLK